MESKANLWLGFCGRNRPVCPAAVWHQSQRGSYPPSHAFTGIQWCVIVQNRNRTATLASLMAPDDCVRCLVSLWSAQEELWRCARPAAGTFLRHKGEFLGGEEPIWGAFPKESGAGLQGDRAVGGMASLVLRNGLKSWRGVRWFERTEEAVKSPESQFLVFTCLVFEGGGSASSSETAATTTSEWLWIQAAAVILKLYSRVLR